MSNVLNKKHVVLFSFLNMYVVILFDLYYLIFPLFFSFCYVVNSAVSHRQINDISRPRDTGGGFLLEDDEDEFLNEERPIVNQPAPLFEEDRPHCEECKNEFVESYLYRNFDHPVCDDCR